MIKISNKKIVNDLRRIGFTNKKTYHIDFPNINENLISNYMLGLVDSDGSFNIKKRSNSLNFNFVGPIDFVEKFQQILIEKCNVSKTKLGLSKTTDFIRLVYYGGYKNILKIVKFLYEKSTTYLSRKKNIAVNYLLTKYPDDKTLNDLSSS